MAHAVIFDVDGTLIRSAHEDDLLYRRAVQRILGQVTFRNSLSDYDLVSDSGILDQLLIDNDLTADPRVIAAVKREFLAATRKHVARHGPFREIPGAKDVLARLRRSERHAVAIATGGWRHTAEFKLASAGFDVAGIPLKSSDDAADRAHIMRLALESLDVPLDAVTYYGDGAWDRQACGELGWEFRAVGPALNGLQSYQHEFVG